MSPHGGAWLLALLSGVLQALAFPLPALDWLCWIALAPLIVAVLAPARTNQIELQDSAGRPVGTPRPLRRAFLLAYFSGIVWYGATCYWIFHVMRVYGGLNTPISVLLLIGFCLYLGLNHGLFGLLLAFTARRGGVQRALLLCPFLWVAVELFRERAIGIPWNLLGTVQVNNIPLTRVATLTGVYGISFEIALINVVFAAAFLVPLRRRGILLGAGLAIAALLQAGRLVHLQPLSTTHVATLVQAEVPILDESDWTTEYFDKTLADLGSISTPAAHDAENMQAQRLQRQGPGLIVWPETPAPFFVTDPRFRVAMSQLASRAQAYIVVGSLGLRFHEQRTEPPDMFNSASLISPNGDWTARYDKNHLVPFGEYVPFKSLLSFADKLTREVGNLERGTDRKPLELGPYRAGVFICYESVFPDEVREFAARGAQVFVNISNDGWFGPNGAPEQHLNQARMRAIENRRWLLRDTNTGITASIDPLGRIVARAPREQRVALEAPYDTISTQTFYTRHGDWFAWSCVIISLVGMLVRWNLRYRVIQN